MAESVVNWWPQYQSPRNVEMGDWTDSYAPDGAEKWARRDAEILKKAYVNVRLAKKTVTMEHEEI